MIKWQRNSIETFHQKYDINENGCWIWRSAKRPTKSPNWYVNGKEQLVHRWSYEYHKGPISPGLVCCHHCDEPHCVNPDHLFLGTQKDNVQDCIKKGRRRKTWKKNKTKTGPEGPV